MSARSTLLTAVKTQQIGVFEYLPKPFELRSLIEVTRNELLPLLGHRLQHQAGPSPIGAKSLMARR